MPDDPVAKDSTLSKLNKSLEVWARLLGALVALIGVLVPIVTWFQGVLSPLGTAPLVYFVVAAAILTSFLSIVIFVRRHRAKALKADHAGWLERAILAIALAIVLSLLFYFYIPPRPMLRLHGSNTLGSEVAPALAESFLKSKGAENVKVVRTCKPEEVFVEGRFPGDLVRKTIEIKAWGSATGFEDLKAGRADIAMSSRPISDDEAVELKKLGKMKSTSCQHDLGIDSIVVIVNERNPVRCLTRDLLRRIFTGELKRWENVYSEIKPGTCPDNRQATPADLNIDIHLYIRDPNSGTRDLFRQRVFGDEDQYKFATAAEFTDSRELADNVADDPAGIGFIGKPFVRRAQPVYVSASGEAGTFFLPTDDAAVNNSRYLLSRDLFFYTADWSRSADDRLSDIRAFTEYALSDGGQKIIANHDFLPAKTIGQLAAGSVLSRSSFYSSLIRGKTQLIPDIHFSLGSTSLAMDSRAAYVLPQIISRLVRDGRRGGDITLIGFADNTGSSDRSKQISLQRASAIKERFKGKVENYEEIHVEGLGENDPIAPNDDELNRSLNRRVEIWITGMNWRKNSKSSMSGSRSKPITLSRLYADSR